MDHVEAVFANSVSVRCASGPLRTELLAFGSASDHGVTIPYTSKQALAAILSHLQQLQVPFGDAPGGWPPAAVFLRLRDEGLVHGNIGTVSWAGPELPISGAA